MRFRPAERDRTKILLSSKNGLTGNDIPPALKISLKQNNKMSELCKRTTGNVNIFLKFIQN